MALRRCEPKIASAHTSSRFAHSVEDDGDASDSRNSPCGGATTAQGDGAAESDAHVSQRTQAFGRARYVVAAPPPPRKDAVSVRQCAGRGGGDDDAHAIHAGATRIRSLTHTHTAPAAAAAHVLTRISASPPHPPPSRADTCGIENRISFATSVACPPWRYLISPGTFKPSGVSLEHRRRGSHRRACRIFGQMCRCSPVPG
jgi:hypothetical protein